MSEQERHDREVAAKVLRDAATALGHVYQSDSAAVTAVRCFLQKRADEIEDQP